MHSVSSTDLLSKDTDYATGTMSFSEIKLHY